MNKYFLFLSLVVNFINSQHFNNSVIPNTAFTYTLNLNMTQEKRLFYINLGLGTPPQHFNFIVSTSARLSFIPSILCVEENCVERRYDSSISASYRDEQFDTIEMYYGKRMKGVLSYDTLLITEKAKDLTNFGFFMVNQNMTKLEKEVDGVLSLNRDTLSQLSNSFGLVDLMACKQLILKNIWSIVRVEDGHKLYIGDKLNTTQNRYCSLPHENEHQFEEMYYSCNLSHISFGEQEEIEDFDRAVIISNYASFEVGYFEFVAPITYANLFHNRLNQKANCTLLAGQENKVIHCTDISRLRASYIGFVFNGYAYSMPIDELFQSPGPSKGHVFLLKFRKNASIWTIGRRFFDHFDITFDKDARRVYLYGNWITDFTEYSKDPEPKESSSWSWFSILGNLILIGVLAYLVYWWVNRKRTKENPRSSGDRYEMMHQNA